jgi:formylglycine-generating enzyme required for sulfatase activity
MATITTAHNSRSFSRVRRVPADQKASGKSRIALWVSVALALPLLCLCCGGGSVGTYFLATYYGKSEPMPAAQPAPRGSEFENSIGTKLVRIDPGRFTMGSPATEAQRNPEEQQHEVEITQPFYLGQHEVTQAQYRTVMGSNPSKAKGDRLPVEQVSWHDAKAFCARLSKTESRTYTLPTEAEWEYACRAGTRTPYSFGNTVSDTQAVFKKGTRVVGSFAPNRWGLYDMHGNVNEWCEDYWGENYYASSPKKDPKGPATGKERVVRGGAWGLNPEYLRAAYRGGYEPDYKNDRIGFRVVLRIVKN